MYREYRNGNGCGTIKGCRLDIKYEIKGDIYMKNKRRIMSVGLATLILSSTFAFGSVVELDPILEKAEEF